MPPATSTTLERPATASRTAGIRRTSAGQLSDRPDANRDVRLRCPSLPQGAARPEVPCRRGRGNRARGPLLRRAGRRDAQPAADAEPVLLPGCTDSPADVSAPLATEDVRARPERGDLLGPGGHAATAAVDRPRLSPSLSV